MKNDGETWSRISYFEIQLAPRVAAAQCKRICPERLNRPGRIAGLSEGAH